MEFAVRVVDNGVTQTARLLVAQDGPRIVLEEKLASYMEVVVLYLWSLLQALPDVPQTHGKDTYHCDGMKATQLKSGMELCCQTVGEI